LLKQDKPEARSERRISLYDTRSRDDNPVFLFRSNARTCMEQTEPANPAGMAYTIFGDDPGDSDQRIRDYYFPGAGVNLHGNLYAAPDGLRFFREFPYPSASSTRTPGGRQRRGLRPGARFVDADGGVRQADTNPVSLEIF
jgi:hypothetical protein